MNPFTALFDLIWSYPAYPELTLASHLTKPDDNLRKFDEITAKRKITMASGADAHSNIGFHLFGDDAGNKLISIKIDAYLTIFGISRVHVSMPVDQGLTPETLIAMLRSGDSHIGLDSIGDTTGFDFALNGIRPGGEIGLTPDATLELSSVSPLPARFVFYKNGERFFEASDSTVAATNTTGSGAYRVEVFRPDLGPPFDKVPWIISNPIYVR